MEKFVTIFEDPITEQKPEGTAELLEKILTEIDGLEYWRVRFLDDGEETLRFIKAEAAR